MAVLNAATLDRLWLEVKSMGRLYPTLSREQQTVNAEGADERMRIRK